MVVGDRRLQPLDGFGVAGPVEHTTVLVTVELFLVPGETFAVFLGGLLKLFDAEVEPVDAPGRVSNASGEESEFGGEGGVLIQQPAQQVRFKHPDLVARLHGAGLALRGGRGS